MSGEEVKIVATLDTSDIPSGTERIISAINGVKSAVENVGDSAQPAAEDAGEKIGTSMMNGMLKRILLRDLIRTAITGVTDIVADTANRLGSLFGENFNFSLKATLQNVSDTVAAALVKMSPVFKQAALETSIENVENIKKDEAHRIEMEKFKENPLLFNKSPEEVEKSIEAITASMAQAKIDAENQKQEIINYVEPVRHNRGRVAGDSAFFLDDKSPVNTKKAPTKTFSEIESDLAASLKTKESDLRDANEQLEIAKRKVEETARIQREADESHKKSLAEVKRDKSEIKKEERFDNNKAIAADRAAAKVAETDLSFERRQLDHQTATSAVRIQGGLFGKNDSAAQLVQHAAEQVNLLRSINMKLGQTREANQELTLQ
jgi:hypothetical protein